MQAEAGMVIWVAQGAVGLLTGRETRKAEEMCRETWRGLPLPPTPVLCAQCVLCLWFSYVRPCLGGRWSRRMHARM